MLVQFYNAYFLYHNVITFKKTVFNPFNQLYQCTRIFCENKAPQLKSEVIQKNHLTNKTEKVFEKDITKFSKKFLNLSACTPNIAQKFGITHLLLGGSLVYKHFAQFLTSHVRNGQSMKKQMDIFRTGLFVNSIYARNFSHRSDLFFANLALGILLFLGEDEEATFA